MRGGGLPSRCSRGGQAGAPLLRGAGVRPALEMDSRTGGAVATPRSAGVARWRVPGRGCGGLAPRWGALTLLPALDKGSLGAAETG